MADKAQWKSCYKKILVKHGMDKETATGYADLAYEENPNLTAVEAAEIETSYWKTEKT